MMQVGALTHNTVCLFGDGSLFFSCHFRRLDGSGLFLSRYARNVTVQRCEFEWLGENAMATWGETDDYDATGGAQPRGTRILNNVVHDIGLYEKQSSAWGQAKACQSHIEGNGTGAVDIATVFAQELCCPLHCVCL